MEDSEKNFDTLILLVGTNPLPNFVVAEYFLKNNPELKYIFMIYSEKTDKQSGTKEYAENLQKLLQNRHEIKPEIKFFTLSDISDAEKIERDLNNNLKNALKNKKHLHLNYTGGTKAMVIHVYRWIEKYGLENHIETSFSYLDARTFKIVDDKKGRITGDLREEIKLKIEDLLSLHGFSPIKLEFNILDNIFDNAIEKFRNIIKEDMLRDFFKSYHRYFFITNSGKLIDKKEKMIERINELKSKEIELKAKGIFLEIFKVIPEDYRLFNDDGSFKMPESNSKLEKVIKFIDGKWLENYLYKILCKTLSDNILAYNLEIKKSDWKSPNQKFEIDLILLKGYQLIGISCTTSSERALCKSKGFEIFMRTKQIGGDEARAILVTTLPENKKIEIQQELEVDTGGRENILVLGIDDLKEEVLTNKIKNYIE